MSLVDDARGLVDEAGLAGMNRLELAKALGIHARDAGDVARDLVAAGHASIFDLRLYTGMPF